MVMVELHVVTIIYNKEFSLNWPSESLVFYLRFTRPFSLSLLYSVDILFPPNEKRGGGLRCQAFSFSYLFPLFSRARAELPKKYRIGVFFPG